MLTFMIRYFNQRFPEICYICIKRNEDKVIDSWIKKDLSKKHSIKYIIDGYRQILKKYVVIAHEFIKSNEIQKL